MVGLGVTRAGLQKPVRGLDFGDRISGTGFQELDSGTGFRNLGTDSNQSVLNVEICSVHLYISLLFNFLSSLGITFLFIDIEFWSLDGKKRTFRDRKVQGLEAFF